MQNHFTQAAAERARKQFDVELQKANLFRLLSLYGSPERRLENARKADAALAEAQQLIRWGGAIMTTEQAALAPVLTQPAALTVRPHPGGVLWCVRVSTLTGARFAAEDLSALGYTGGIQTWEDSPPMLIIHVPMPAREALREVCARYDRPQTWAAGLDVTGTWEGF